MRLFILSTEHILTSSNDKKIPLQSRGRDVLKNNIISKLKGKQTSD
jgi:hypothetical protein